MLMTRLVAMLRGAPTAMDAPSVVSNGVVTSTTAVR
jgi:hypothetical protein